MFMTAIIVIVVSELHCYFFFLYTCIFPISSLFSELMEGMQQFYLNATLESDFAMARDRKLANMKYDPRKATPFESKEILAPVS